MQIVGRLKKSLSPANQKLLHLEFRETNCSSQKWVCLSSEVFCVVIVACALSYHSNTLSYALYLQFWHAALTTSATDPQRLIAMHHLLCILSLVVLATAFFRWPSITDYGGLQIPLQLGQEIYNPWCLQMICVYCKFIHSYDTRSRALPPLRILKIALMIGVRVEGEDLSHVKIVLTPSILAVGRSLPPLSCREEDCPHLDFYHLPHAKNWGEASLISWSRPAFHHLQAMKGWVGPGNKPLLHVVYCKQSRAGGGSGLQKPVITTNWRSCTSCLAIESDPLIGRNICYMCNQTGWDIQLPPAPVRLTREAKGISKWAYHSLYCGLQVPCQQKCSCNSTLTK